MCRPANPEERGIAGFTLIEALAALAVMGAGLAAIGTLASSSLRAGLYAERHLAEIETARKIIAGMPAEVIIPTGERTAFSYMISPLVDSMRRGFRE